MNTKTALSNALKKLMDKAVFKNNSERDYRRLRLNRKMFRGCARFARDFFTDGIIGIIIAWLNGKIKLDKTSAVKHGTEILKGSLTSAESG